jgi:GT2 family glycosyltransferase
VKRPPVDVVVPFAGSQQALADLLRRLSGLKLAEGDSLVVVDNRPEADGPSELPPGVATIVRAPERQSSYFARNAGARRGEAEWILFIDADVEPPADLLDRYFERAPAARTAVLAGAIDDEGPLPGRRYRAPSGYGHLKPESTLGRGRWSYAHTANCAVRRTAFDEVGGFAGEIRSGGDADLCFRLRDAGWALEPREEAAAVHRGRSTLPDFLRQVFRHGSGAAWLNRVHPGSAPPEPWRLAAQTGRMVVSIPYRLLAAGGVNRALARVVELLGIWAFAVGRLVPNESPSRRIAPVTRPSAPPPRSSDGPRPR